MQKPFEGISLNLFFPLVMSDSEKRDRESETTPTPLKQEDSDLINEDTVSLFSQY